MTDSGLRVDKWLWHVRVFKTRSAAADACRGGRVRRADQAMKPAQEVRIGDVLTVRVGVITRTLRVAGLAGHRLGPKLVPEHLADLTPAEEYEKLKDPMNRSPVARLKGSGRPTKKDRRAIDRFFL
jgi:ribosome-associated heat shock protein Hsp15